MALTEEHKKEYLESGGSKCPYCGSTNISAEHFEAEGSEGWQRVDCEDCGKSWNDLYTLTGVEEREE